MELTTEWIKENLSQANQEFALAILLKLSNNNNNIITGELLKINKDKLDSIEDKGYRFNDIEIVKNTVQYKTSNKVEAGTNQYSSIGHVNQSNNNSKIQSYIELFGDSVSNWNGNPIPNVITGKCDNNNNNVPSLSFAAIKDENYTKVLSGVLFRFVNGYVDNTTLLDILVDKLKLSINLDINNNQIIDSEGSTGTDGQVLTKVNGKIKWM